MTTFPDDYQTAVKAFEKNTDKKGTRGYYRGYFNLKKVGDTFLNFETWGKGQVYVNGHAMGRIWYIGPQQTLFIPGC
jgi:beta-galactosidase